jgi:hypothetical protein
LQRVLVSHGDVIDHAPDEALNTADRQEDEVAQVRTVRLGKRLEALRRQMRELQEMERAVADAPDQQIALADPDARAMATAGKGAGLVGCNLQAAVDADNHIIVAHEVTNVRHDRSQLANMGRKAREATGWSELTVLAHRGYFSGVEVLACEREGITAIRPKPLTPGPRRMVGSANRTSATSRLRTAIAALPVRCSPPLYHRRAGAAAPCLLVQPLRHLHHQAAMHDR